MMKLVEQKGAIDNGKVKELANWKNNQVYPEVEDKNQTEISIRWVITTKVIGEDKIIKARLVARGFEDEEIKRLTTDSPTFSKESLHIVLTIMSIDSWNFHSLDVKTAFLQGNQIDRDVFNKSPKKANVQGSIWKLNKVVYGLADVSCAWYLHVKDVLAKLGLQMSLIS